LPPSSKRIERNIAIGVFIFILSDMTQEEIAKVKAMSREQRRRHFKPLFMANKLTFKQYEALICIEDTLLRMETVTTPQESTHKQEHGTDVQPPREDVPPPQEDWVSALARQFGGTVLPDSPTGKQGRLDEKSEQILRNMTSG